MIVGTSCTSQVKSLNDLKGKWRVNEVKSLIPGVYNESELEYNDRLNSLKQCKGSSVYISDTLISFEEKKCSFFECNDFTQEEFCLTVVDDLNEEISYDNIDHNKQIGKSVIKLINANYSFNKINAIFTNCPTGEGESRVKILLLETNKIVIFQYYNIIILER
jgi:hypothetical protein